MVPSIASGKHALRVQATATTMRMERVWDTVTRRSNPFARGSAGVGYRPPTFGDVAVVVCFLALIGIVVLAGVFTVFSWVTAGLPARLTGPCPEFARCAPAEPGGGQPVEVGDRRIDGAQMTP